MTDMTIDYYTDCGPRLAALVEASSLDNQVRQILGRIFEKCAYQPPGGEFTMCRDDGQPVRVVASFTWLAVPPHVTVRIGVIDEHEFVIGTPVAVA